MSETVFLKVTSAFLVGGEIAKKGEIVELTPNEARDLLARGKAVPATAGDAPTIKAAPAPEADQPAESGEGEGEEDEGQPLSTESIGLEEPARRGRRKK